MQTKYVLLGLAMAAGLMSAGAAHAADAPPAVQPSPATTPPPATTTPPTAQPAATGTAPRAAAQPQFICKKTEPRLGSRIGGRKICRTAAQWRALQEASREYVEDVQGRARTSVVTP